MNAYQKCFSKCLLTMAAFLSAASFQAALAQSSAPPLSAALQNFAVLGGVVTCTDSLVVGDVGGTFAAASPTRCTFTGRTPPATNAAAALARTDFASAYAALKAMACNQGALTGTLDGRTLTPGVYCFSAAAALAGTLTLDAQGNPDAVWIFQIGAALAGTNFSVVMINGGQPCNVFWVPGAAATMTTSALKGNILAGGPTGAITLTGGSLTGRALATVAVTMTDALVGCGGLAALSGTLSCKVKDRDGDDEDKEHRKCNQGVGNGSEDCDPGHSDRHNPFGSNDEHGGTPGNPGRKGGNN